MIIIANNTDLYTGNYWVGLKCSHLKKEMVTVWYDAHVS